MIHDDFTLCKDYKKLFYRFYDGFSESSNKKLKDEGKKF